VIKRSFHRQEYVWLLDRCGERGLFIAAFFSLVVHAIVFGILVTTSVFYPTAGNAEKFDILWHYASPAPAEAANAARPMPQDEESSPESSLTADSAINDASLPTEQVNGKMPEEPPQHPDQQPDIVQILQSQQKEAPPSETEEKVAAEKAEILRQQLEALRAKQAERERQAIGKAQKDLAALKAEQERQAQEQLTRSKLLIKAAEDMRMVAEKLAAEKIAAEKAKQERLAGEQAENKRLAALKAEEEHLERENEERLRVAAANGEQDRIAAEEASREKAVKERLAKENSERKRLAALKLEQELLARHKNAAEQAERKRLAAEKAEQERLSRENLERKRLEVLRSEQEQIAREKAGRERVAAQSFEKEQIAARQKAEQDRLVREKQVARVAALKSEQDRLALEKAERKRVAAENAEKERKRVGLQKAEQQRATQERAESEKKTARTTAKIAVKTEPPVQRLTEPATNPGNSIDVAEGKSQQATTAKPPTLRKVLSRSDEQSTHDSVGTSPEAKGIFSIPLAGDLKLQMRGDYSIKLTVEFKPYPKNRRHRPMTGSEAKRSQKLTPVIVKTAQDTTEAVIETAEAGIYDFIVDSTGTEPVSTAFTLKLYADTARANIRSLGTKKIGEKTVIVKVLMPEGILWDDAAAFSGYMEDSESVTKFSSQTGLVWKEYR